MKHFNRFVVRAARNLGLDLQRYDANLNFDATHARILSRLGIDLTLDVGANIGQFGNQLRGNYEFSGEIISFEPLSSARSVLEKVAGADPRWSIRPFALGDEDSTQSINISGNSQSSSILRMEENHLNAAPGSSYIGSEEIEVRTLDGIYASLGAEGKNVFLKLDVQGFEDRVITGAAESLKKILAVRLEMSVRPLYQSEILIDGMIPKMRNLGFYLVAIEPNFVDPITGALLQVDGLFAKI